MSMRKVSCIENIVICRGVPSAVAWLPPAKRNSIAVAFVDGRALDVPRRDKPKGSMYPMIGYLGVGEKYT